jgi:hypothetical protein
VRLDIGRMGIGVELAAPVRLGCVSVVELVARLSGMRFPVDVTGGVARFRHRRGLLERVGLEVRAYDAERWAETRLAGMFGARATRVWLGVRHHGATVCAEFREDSYEGEHEGPVLAFELDVLAENEDLVAVVHDARGMNLPRSAMGAALACAHTLFAGIATRSGATFRLVRGAASLAREVLPRAGARAPAAFNVSWTSILASGDVWALVAMAGVPPQAPSAEALRARELASLLVHADDAIFEGNDIAARDLCLAALERAPRQPAIVARILDIDARAGGRAEAALSLMNEARQAATGEIPGFDLMCGTLLAETGDIGRAVATLERCALKERPPALGARAAALAASLCPDPGEAARLLDEALLRDPRSVGTRWLRVAKRLELGRPGDALADIEHLEALARGGTAKHSTWMRAGGLWRAAGVGWSSGELFERALRYVPDDPIALAGLGAALVEGSRSGDGRERRGIALLSRALAVSERSNRPSEAIRLDLARYFAERLHDLPTAVAHVSHIGRTAAEAGMARGLEGRWRANLGDPVGASLAFERLREHAESLPPLAENDTQGRAVVGFLVEAAELFERTLRDLRGAHRFLEVALDLCPTDSDLRAKYRALGERALPFRRLSAFTQPEEQTQLDAADASARVEELTERLRADPRHDAVADELAFLLERLGRSHELLALLCARLDDASAEKRSQLLPRAREALERLAKSADAGARPQEASLMRSALAALSGSR